MRHFRYLVLCLGIFICAQTLHGQNSTSDSLKLGQAYMNLYLTETFFDSLTVVRISKILPFEQDELNSLQDSSFLKQNTLLYNFTSALLHLNEAKLLYRTKKNPTRSELISWKDKMQETIDHFVKARLYELYEQDDKTFFELINFDEEAYYDIDYSITALKANFTPYFNEDIFPDFKRLFLRAKNSNTFHLDSLNTFAEIYNLNHSLSILNNEWYKPGYYGSSRNNTYRLAQKLELLSMYLQIKYLVSQEDAVIPDDFDVQQLYDAYYYFTERLEDEEDSFIREELNEDVIMVVHEELKQKFPHEYIPDDGVVLGALTGDGIEDSFQYFFPSPAPMPSARLFIANYKPNLKTLGAVDSHLKRRLVSAGYEKELHYYYAMDGFAITTSLEKFNKDGSPVPREKQFIKELGGEGKFSYFEIFKSLFFEIESEFRMFAFIVATRNAQIGNEALSARRAEELIKNSYDELPEDLENKTVSRKNLTVLVYHFHQDDIGRVPMLDLSGKPSAKKHLENAKLSSLLSN